MKVCVAGAGAIGSLIGARLASHGEARVSALARGATLAALRRDGWWLQHGEQVLQTPVQADDDARALGVQDLVVIAVKAPALPDLAPALAPLIGPQTVLLTAMNGVPWWFCDGVAGLPPGPLASVDPGGRLAAALPTSQLLGAVVHASASVLAPGRVQHVMGQRLVIGEPAGGVSDRVLGVAALLRGAGFEAEASPAIRQEIWFKLWGNMTMNPVSALTGATLDAVLADPLVRGFCSAAMREAAQVGAALGCPIEASPEDRHAVTARLGAIRTSMLQDVQAGRGLELDALVGAVHEIARRLGIATPNIDALLGLTRLMARQRGLYPLATPGDPPH